mmetsp:Transcript_8321/g.6216  ORF Transcript_8321/g.6216 Transcript_8321/m.6216 type:complete len:81 (+) Transcript_8321:286-528(+)
MDSASYQKTYQDDLDVGCLVDEDIFKQRKSLNLERLFQQHEDSMIQPGLQQQQSPEEQHTNFWENGYIRLLNPDIFHNNI